MTELKALLAIIALVIFVAAGIYCGRALCASKQFNTKVVWGITVFWLIAFVVAFLLTLSPNNPVVTISLVYAIMFGWSFAHSLGRSFF